MTNTSKATPAVDVSREAVEEMLPYKLLPWHAMNTDVSKMQDMLRALLDRAEKAEQGCDDAGNIIETMAQNANQMEAEIAALKADAMRLHIFEQWANEGKCPTLVFNDNGWWAVTFDGTGPVSLDEPPPSGDFMAFVDANQWRETVGEAIDAACEAIAYIGSDTPMEEV